MRDRLSLDNWRTINRLTHDNAFGREVTFSGALNWLDRAVSGLMTLSGFALDGMTRDTGWRFMSIGRRIDRAYGQCYVIEMHQVIRQAVRAMYTEGGNTPPSV